MAASNRLPQRSLAGSANRRNFDKVPVRQLSSDRTVSLASNKIRRRQATATNAYSSGSNQPIRNVQSDDMEIIVVVRNRNAGSAESFAINNPSSDLMDQLRSAQQPQQRDESVQSRFAQLRRDMPNLQGASGKNYRTADVRAQSPK